jgi:hypothetical protein
MLEMMFMIDIQVAKAGRGAEMGDEVGETRLQGGDGESPWEQSGQNREATRIGTGSTG